MAFCEKCGNEISPGAAFCSSCGAKAGGEPQETERRQSFDGTMHKCPNCGEILASFTAKCPSCGFEIRDVKSSQPVKTFAEKLNKCQSDIEKIEMIKSFPIPNTKEDIMEFMILAYTNFDSANYVGKKSSHGLAEAWMVKMDQCKLKTGMLFTSNDPAYISINEMYKKTTDKIADCKKQAGAKRYKRTPGYWVKIIAAAFAVFMTLGSFISGSVPSGLFGIAMTGGIIVSILMGLGTIPGKYPIIKMLVFIAALACFVPLVIFLP